jgi:uncharacterized protein (TIGR02996 family)
MSDRSALLAAIRADPRDEALRLVYADWLEEFGGDEDRTLADFIRLQCRFEPLRDDHFTEQARELRRLEARLLEENRERWLGLPPTGGAWEEGFAGQFRRGMVERLCMRAEEFVRRGEALAERFAAFHRLFLFDFEVGAPGLAGCPALAAVRELTLADELREEDAVALVRSPHLGRVEKLRVWVWRDSAARFALHLANLPGLREVELYQIVGGDYRTDEIDEEVRAFAAQFQAKCRVPVRLVNPYDRRFPLDGRLHHGLFAGQTRDRRPTLVRFLHGGLFVGLLHFDDDGRLVDQQQASLEAEESLERQDDGWLLRRLHEVYGFEPGLIHVRQTSSDALWVGLPYWGDWESHHVLAWHEAGEFRITYWGDDLSVGPDGKVRST